MSKTSLFAEQATQFRPRATCSAKDDVKIFAVTGEEYGDEQLPIRPTGVDRWFNKPIDPADLADAPTPMMELGSLCGTSSFGGGDGACGSSPEMESV